MARAPGPWMETTKSETDVVSYRDHEKPLGCP